METRPAPRHWMQTFSGVAFDLENPRSEDVRIEDIARALSRLQRYTGHTHRPWSVAQHAMACANHCLMAWHTEPEIAYQALHHDSHEAYVGDMSSPMKGLVGDAFRAVERNVWAAVAGALGLPVTLDPRIKEIDYRILENEAASFMSKPPQPWNFHPKGKLPYTIQFLQADTASPDQVMKDFLWMHRQLTEARAEAHFPLRTAY